MPYRQDTTKNLSQEEAAEQLRALLQLPWSSASLQSSEGPGLTVQVSRRGRALMQRAAPPPPPPPAATGPGAGAGGQEGAGQAAAARHDRRKALLIPGDVPDPFLQKIGLQTSDGRDKFVQINKFVELLVHTGELERLLAERGAAAHAAPGHAPAEAAADAAPGAGGDAGGGGGAVRLLDCGCGSAHLTFGAYHYLANVKGARVELTGVDTNAALMDRSNRYCQDLGMAPAASFVASPIRSFRPPQPPDIVLALHACDTATDEALALGVSQGARVIMSVPCCQKDLHRQYTRAARAAAVSGGGGDGALPGALGAAAGFELPGLLPSGDGGGVASDDEAGWGAGSGAEEAEAEGDGDEVAGAGGVGALFSPLLRHGILRQRWLDLLTDALRAQLLRVAGYRVDVVEFVSGEHTPRNLLIRAVRLRTPPPAPQRRRMWGEYAALKAALGVTPHLEKLLDGQLLPEASAAAPGGKKGGRRGAPAGRRRAQQKGYKP